MWQDDLFGNLSNPYLKVRPPVSKEPLISMIAGKAALQSDLFR